ncbi:MAG: hypothetical protein ISP91_10750 [Pseudomonadales bacterium]|jgi:hypothetical protein|nr:hypothetical protein [Pseudomonadales bacterium]
MPDPSADTENASISEARANEQPFGLHGSGSAPDWRIWLGLSITVIWLLTLAIYVEHAIGWRHIYDAPIERVGNFLEGAFAPLAFLWLVIGYFLQKKELMQNTDAIKMQYVEIQKSAEQAVIQSEAVRRQAFIQVAESVRQQLGAIAAFLFLSSQSANERGVVSQERIGELWESLNNSDPEGFSRSLLQIRANHGPAYAYKLVWGTPIRTKHSDNFIFNFERLLEEASEADSKGMIHDALLGSAHGRLYQWMIEMRETPPEGFRYGEYDFDPDEVDEPA